MARPCLRAASPFPPTCHVQGSVIAVSHDRYFLRQIATRILQVGVWAVYKLYLFSLWETTMNTLEVENSTP